MLELLERLWAFVRTTRLVRPALVAVVGIVGVDVARNHTDNAPTIVFFAAAAVVVGAALRERGLAIAGLGIGAAAAWATPAGLGPLLVAAGIVVAAGPATIDRRIAAWPEVVDGLVALPALAGLASVAAAQPSDRGVVVAVTAVVAVGVSWWRGPRNGHVTAMADSVASYLGALGALGVALVPDRLTALGALPDATVQAAHSVATALAVFAVACLIQALREERLAAR